MFYIYRKSAYAVMNNIVDIEYVSFPVPVTKDITRRREVSKDLFPEVGEDS